MGDGRKAPGGANIAMPDKQLAKGGKMNFSLKGKVAVITGAGGDIGFALAKVLGEFGAKIVISDINHKNLSLAEKKIGMEKSQQLAIMADVADPKQVDLLMKATVEKFHRIDILVTAAGIVLRKPAIEFTADEWEKVLKINLSGTFYCSQAAAKYMQQKKSGKIIMISSLTAEIGIPNMVPYVASRGAIRQLCKALAVEWAPFGINVNCLGPGRMRTKMTEDLFSDVEKSKSFLRLIPMGRPGVPSDLSGIAVLLASDLSNYITGQSIYVDGGWLASGGNPLG